MMRKDVKLGFAIGGVLLAVLVVYVLVGTGGGDQKSGNPGGAGIVTEDTSGRSAPRDANGETGGAGKVAQGSSPRVGESSTSNNLGSISGNSGPIASGPATAPSNESASAKHASADQPRDPNNDLWETALTSGQLLISKTPDVPGGAIPPAGSTGSLDAPGVNTSVPPRATPTNGAADIRGTSSNTGTLAIANDNAGLKNDPTTRPADTMRTSPPTDTGRASNGASSTGTSGNGTDGNGGLPSVAREHVIHPGETLTSISQMAYGNPNLYPHILRANPNLDPKKMRPGTTIVLPAIEAQPASATIGGSGSTNAANTSSSPSPSSIDSTSEYRVQQNDSLYRIAMKLYGKPDMANKLYEMNRQTIGSDPARLKLNMVLKLPEPPTQSAGR